MLLTPDNTKVVDIALHNVPIHWDLDQGKLSFFGIDATLLWTDPSLSNMLVPIADELGVDLFRLLIAFSSSLGTEEDYHAMISTLATNFKDGFLAWGKAVAVAGWGAVEMTDYNPEQKRATVIITNPWEISAQKKLMPEQRWGAPFLQGKLIGIFSHAFNAPCWAIDTCNFDSDKPYVEIEIFESNMTIANELTRLRSQHVLDKERELIALVEQRTHELKEAKDKLEEYSFALENKVEERTESLMNLNIHLEAEINMRKQTEEKLAELNQELLKLTLTDALTGVANRRQFDKVLFSEWNRAIRSQTPLCLIIADVDDFKKYNDTYGHQMGDVCLQTIAKLLSSKARRSADLVARYGGEEFAFILPMTNTQEVVDMLGNLIQALGHLNFPHISSELGHVTMSFGMAMMVPQNNQSLDLLIKKADDALYAAKAQGKNRYVIY